MRLLIILIVGWVASAPSTWAHPGPLDACGGHVAEQWVEYPANPDGQPAYPSEPGEYHFHFQPEQMAVIRESLAAYKQTHPQFVPMGDGRLVEDYGSFTIEGKTYDILEYTRQHRAAILHCQDDDEVTHAGIARIRP